MLSPCYDYAGLKPNPGRTTLDNSKIFAAIDEQINNLQEAKRLLGGRTPTGNHTGKRTLSATARRSMRLAQKTRWAKVAADKHASGTAPKRTMSASARRKIAAAQRARWALVKRTA